MTAWPISFTLAGRKTMRDTIHCSEDRDERYKPEKGSYIGSYIFCQFVRAHLKVQCTVFNKVHRDFFTIRTKDYWGSGMGLLGAANDEWWYPIVFFFGAKKITKEGW
jgi:hypothetical protein